MVMMIAIIIVAIVVPMRGAKKPAGFGRWALRGGGDDDHRRPDAHALYRPCRLVADDQAIALGLTSFSMTSPASVSAISSS